MSEKEYFNVADIFGENVFKLRPVPDRALTASTLGAAADSAGTSSKENLQKTS